VPLCGSGTDDGMSTRGNENQPSRDRCQFQGNKKEDIRTNHIRMNTSQEWIIAEMDAWLSEMRAWQKEMKVD
jgi:hypothetical protein